MRVPHSFAFVAKGWETTAVSIMGLPRHHQTTVVINGQIGERNADWRDHYSPSCSNFPSVGLCFSSAFAFFFRSGTTCSGRGAPIRSRASALTAVTARKGFLFFVLAMVLIRVYQPTSHFAASHKLWNNRNNERETKWKSANFSKSVLRRSRPR